MTATDGACTYGEDRSIGSGCIKPAGHVGTHLVAEGDSPPVRTLKPRLTPTQLTLAELLAEGCTRKYAACLTRTSTGTVDRLITQMITITGTTNVASLVAYLVHLDLIRPNFPTEETQ